MRSGNKKKIILKFKRKKKKKPRKNKPDQRSERHMLRTIKD